MGQQLVAQQIAKVAMTGRDMRDYEYHFPIKLEQFKGQKVLDLGSGLGHFVKQCRDLGIEAVGIDWQVHLPEARDSAYGDLLRDGQVAGSAEELPIRTASIKLAVSLVAPFFYLKDNYPDMESRFDATKRTLKEMARVLEPGGQAYVDTVHFVWPSDNGTNDTNRRWVAKAFSEITSDARIKWEFLGTGSGFVMSKQA
jgi:ubiquinone/menaquinone biosynthesis C-methylase UbiE